MDEGGPHHQVMEGIARTLAMALRYGATGGFGPSRDLI